MAMPFGLSILMSNSWLHSNANSQSQICMDAFPLDTPRNRLISALKAIQSQIFHLRNNTSRYVYWLSRMHLSKVQVQSNVLMSMSGLAFSLGLLTIWHWVFTRCPRLPYRGFLFGGALSCVSCLSISTGTQSIQLLSLSFIYLLIVLPSDWRVTCAACQALTFIDVWLGVSIHFYFYMWV